MLKVLLVEDSDMNRELMTRRLAKQGYEVICATDGQQAVETSKSEMPDIILMDMNLPVMDGMQATREIRSCEQTKQIPIIALTAHEMSTRGNEMDALGCDEYESKPVDFKRLVGKIEELVREKSN